MRLRVGQSRPRLAHGARGGTQGSHPSSTHLIAVLVGLSREVVGKDFKDTFFTGQLLPPHLQQLFLWGLALQVEEVVVLQLPKGRRGGVAPGGGGARRSRHTPDLGLQTGASTCPGVGCGGHSCESCPEGSTAMGLPPPKKQFICNGSPAAVGELIPLLGAINVTLWSGGPEDGTDIFLPALGVGTDGPGQGTSG